jgi:hypothetical protein
MAGIGLTGVGSVGTVLASATPSRLGMHATSPESGAIRVRLGLAQQVRFQLPHHHLVG